MSVSWILLSDRAVEWADIPAAAAARVQSVKGVGFVALSAGVLYWLVGREVAAAARAGELLRAVADGTTDSVFVKDLDGRYLLANPATAQVLGIPPDQVLGRTDAELFDPDSARVIRDYDRRVLAAGRPLTEEKALTVAGVTRTFLATKAPYRDAAGAVAGVIGISRDMTPQRRLAAERDALLARLQLQFERMPLAYVQFGADLTVTDWNPAAERIFGYSRGEVIGQVLPFEKLVPASFRPAAEVLLARIRAGDMAAHSVNENLTKDGRTITCEWFNTPIMDGRRFTGMISLARDVTAEKALEEQYRQAQKMEAVGRLAGGIAHDFNNLLTVINGYSELLLASLRPGDPGRGPVAEIHKAGERSAGLTRQLLAFSRRQVLAPQVVDLNAVVADTTSLLRRVIGEDVRLVADLDPDLAPVTADPVQLGQALVNLAVNARDAMPTGGALTVATRNREDGLVEVAVTDTGVGMTEEVRAHVFEPFFTTKEVGKGTGLGLAMVYGFVTQSGGAVAVETAPGRGTTFRVALPRAAGPAPRGDDRPGAVALARGTETVLVAEDEDAVRALSLHVLTAAGYTILEAGDGAAAVRVAGDHRGRIDLLVTDVVMPGMGGRAVAERVAGAHPGLKVLYLSGYTDDAVVRHGVRGAEVAFLQKPFSPAALAAKVREVLDRPA